MLRINFLVVMCCCLGLTSVAQDMSNPDFVMPLKLPPVVSGSFGELRSNHFHSGLDLTTSGKTGYRVYACDKGYVSRLKISPWGYGKALYIDHPGGYTTVYAHMERYSHRIDSLVKARQYEQKSYSIELFFKKGELPVERGEIIGYSGNSGSSGGPHLHYEIRHQATQKPIDPMLFRDDVKDDVRPQIQGIKLYPLSKEASVKGKADDYYSSTVFYGGEFHPKGWKQVKAYGKIGIGVQVLDYLSDSWRKCGVASIRLFVNDSLVYHSQVDEFSFAETRYLNAHIDYAEKVRTGKVIQRSYVLPNNRLSIYKKKNTYNVNVLSGEQYRVKYLIKDVSGNLSVLAFDIVGDKPVQVVATKEDNRILKYNQAYSIDSMGIKIDVPAYAFYDDVPFLIHRSDSLVKGCLAPVYSVGDYHIPVHKFMTFAVPVNDSLMPWKDKLCMAGVTVTGNIYSRGGSYEDGFIKASTRNFGRISLAIDTVAPEVKLRNAPFANNYSNRSFIELIIIDDFSGIDKYECLVDGEWTLFEYDAKCNKLIGSLKDMSLVKGQHQLEAVVIDKKGNVSRLKEAFIL